MFVYYMYYILPGEDLILPWEDVTGHEVLFPQPCSTMAVTSMAGQVSQYNILTA